MFNLETFFFNLAAPEVRSRVSANALVPHHFSYDSLDTLLLLIDWEKGGAGASQAASAFVRRAKDMGLPLSSAKMLTFNGTVPQDFRCENFTPKDFNWKGMPKCGRLKALLDASYDVLVDYSDGCNPYLQRILRLAKAALKVGHGVGAVACEHYDLMVDLPQLDYERYNEHIFDYLKHISV